MTRSVVVRDDAAEIARAVGEAWGAYDLIVTTGGIGPTSDDRTREAVARWYAARDGVFSAPPALRTTST